MHFAFAQTESVGTEDAASAGQSASSEATERLEQPARVAESRQPSFNIWQYEISGVTLLPADAVEQALYPYLGADLSLETVEQATDALEALYRDSGYPTVLVDIPEQNVTNGRVQLKVTEGAVSRVWVKDSDYFLLSDIRERTPSIKVGESLYIPDVQDEIATLNTLSSDLRVIPIMRAGSKPGTVEVDLKVRDSNPLHGDIEYNDHYSANTTKYRASASIRYDNLWQYYHSLSLQYQTAPEATDEVKVLVGTYVMPVQNAKGRLAIYAVNSDSEVATIGAGTGLQVFGKSKIYGTRYVRPMTATPGFQQVFTLGLDYKDVEEQIFQGLEDDEPIFTPITYSVWSIMHDATWRKGNSSQKLSTGVHFGLREILANDISEFEDKRYKGEPNFFYLKLGYRRDDDLFRDVRLNTSIRGQYSDTPLVSNEQFNAGGADSVRGYLEAQKQGDKGWIGNVELLSPKLFTKSGWIDEFRLFLFYDAAAVAVVEPLADQTVRFELASKGIGMNFKGLGGFDIQFAWAVPLKDLCDGECDESGEIAKDQDRTTFSINYSF